MRTSATQRLSQMLWERWQWRQKANARHRSCGRLNACHTTLITVKYVGDIKGLTVRLDFQAKDMFIGARGKKSERKSVGNRAGPKSSRTFRW